MKRQNKYHFFFGGFRNSLYLCNVVWLRLYDFAECLKKRYFTNYNIKVMKKLLLMKTMLLLCALIVGSSSVWAEEIKYNFTSKQWTAIIDGTSTSADWTSGKDGAGFSNNGVQVTTSVTGANATSPISYNNISKIVVTYNTNKSKGAGTFEVKIGTNEAVSKDWAYSTGDGTSANYTLQYDYATPQSGSVKITANTTTNSIYVSSIAITYTPSSTPTCATPTFSPAAGTYTSAQNVTISTETDGATIYYTTDGTDPTASSTEYTGAINVSTTTTIKAIAVKDGNNNSAVATATYTILEHAGTQADPYTVADARAAIDANVGVTGVYVTGIVCVGGSNLSSGAMNYWISDDGTETDKFEVYKGKNLNNTNFSAVTDVIVGDQVVVYGNIKKYNTTYEFDQGNYLVSIVSIHPSVALDKTAINATYEGADGTINVVYNNITTVVAEVVFCDENGDDATYDWILADLNASNNVEYIIDANTGAARTAYFMVKALDDNSKEVFSDIVTITQTACPYATLPFAFNGGKNNIASTAGLSQSGLGTDYKTAPYLKFDNTGDYVILQIGEVPGSLSFDIQGNSFADGTFTVQTSADGETYTDLKAYTELSGTKTTETFALASTVRYIKWIYTEKADLTNVIPVTVSAAGLATFANDYALDFTNVENLEAYIAKENGSTIELHKVNKVPANTGVLLRAKNDATDFNVPVTTAAADDVTDNIFVRGTGAVVESGTGPYNYVLGKHDGVVGFYKAGGMVVATNKAYLQTTVAKARINIDFDDVTALTLVNSEKRTVNSDVFDLQGRKVANPTKGLYIVNGKKVVVK